MIRNIRGVSIMRQSYHLVNLVAVATLSASFLIGTDNSVKADQPVNIAADVPANAVKGFNYTVTVLGDNGKTLAGQQVSLFDTTGARVEYASGTTDSSGRITFENLPLSHNFSVSINGQVQGYTARSDQENANLLSSFKIAGQGTGLPSYSKSAITITVRDEEGIPLADKNISLKDKEGNLLSTKPSDSNGRIMFSDQLMDGTYYGYYLDDQLIGEAIPGESRNVYVDTSVAPASEKTQGFTFIATVLDDKGLTLANKEVVLTDITDGSNGPKTAMKTNGDGEAIFSNLDLSRNFSVAVEDSDQAYTVRTDRAGAELRSSFIAKGQGEKQPKYSTDPLVVVVRDANSEPLPGQKVVLKDVRNHVVGEMVTEQDGKAIFTNGLLDGTFYHISVNELQNVSEAMPGSERSVYLTDEQIVSPDDATTADKTEDGATKSSNDNIQDPKNQKKDGSAREENKPRPGESQRLKHEGKGKSGNLAVVNKANKSSQDRNIKRGDKQKGDKTASLPVTGDSSNAVMTWLGAACLALVSILVLAKKRQGK